MTDKIVPFRTIAGGADQTPAPAPVDAETVTELRRLLAMAEAGEISGIALVALGPERVTGGVEDVTTGWTGSARSNVHTMLGGIAHLQLRFHAERFQKKG